MTSTDNEAMADEISLYDIVVFFQETWKQILGITLAGSFIGVLVVLFAPKSFEASVSIQGAQVAGRAVDEPAVLLEKLKQPTFFTANTVATCLPNTKIDANATLVKALNPSLSRTAPVISLTFGSSSPQAASTCLAAVVKDFVQKQEAQAEQLMSFKQEEQKRIQEKVKSVEQTIELIEKQPINLNIPDAKFSPSSLMLSLYAAKQSELAQLRTDLDKVNTDLVFPQTRVAGAIAPIYAPERPKSPKPALTLALATLLGLFGGVFLLLVKRGWDKMRQEHAAQLPTL